MKIDNLKLEHFDNGISVIQSDNYYKFTQDAILLAKFCNIKHTDNVLELCAGISVPQVCLKKIWNSWDLSA